MIQNANTFHQTLHQSIQPLVQLFQTVLIQRMNDEHQRHINQMQTTRQMWQTQNESLSPLLALQQNRGNDDSKENTNITTETLIVDSIKQSKDKLNSSLRDQMSTFMDYLADRTKYDYEYYTNNILLKSVIQQIFGMQYGMEMQLQNTVSINYLAFWKSDKDNFIEEDEKKKKELMFYDVYVLSHGAQFIDEIENDIKALNITIEDKTEENTEDVYWKCECGDVFAEDSLCSILGLLFGIQLEELMNEVVEKTILRENEEKVIKLKLSFDKKYEYDYSMTTMFGPFIIGNMNTKYFPKSLNAKYMRIYENITDAFIGDIYRSSSDKDNYKKIIPNAIIDLVKKFYMTTLDEYPFGPLVVEC